MSADQRPLPATYAALVLKGENLDPDLVSATMEQKPTVSYRRGDPYSAKDQPRERRFGLWVYSTRNVVESKLLERHLEALEILILGERPAWSERKWMRLRELVESQDAELRIDVFWYGPKSWDFPEIGLSFQHLIDEVGGTVQVDFHRDGDETQAA